MRLVRARPWGIAIGSVLAAAGLSACRHEPPTASETIGALVDRADRLVVRQERQDDSPVLFESSDRADLDALREALQVQFPDADTTCFCSGGPIIELFAGKERLAQIANRNAHAITCELWPGEAPLLDPERWAAWFDQRGMPEVRAVYEYLLQQERESEAEAARWTAAMPASVKPLWKDIWEDPAPDIAEVEAALEREFPDSWDRILALLEWYGSTSLAWNEGSNAEYETFPGRLLLRCTSKDVRFAVDVADELTPAQLEGLARLFARRGRTETRLGDVSILPAELKERLRLYCLDSEDEFKQGAARVFGAE